MLCNSYRFKTIFTFKQHIINKIYQIYHNIDFNNLKKIEKIHTCSFTSTYITSSKKIRSLISIANSIFKNILMELFLR